MLSIIFLLPRFVVVVGLVVVVVVGLIGIFLVAAVCRFILIPAEIKLERDSYQINPWSGFCLTILNPQHQSRFWQLLIFAVCLFFSFVLNWSYSGCAVLFLFSILTDIKLKSWFCPLRLVLSDILMWGTYIFMTFLVIP